MTPFFSVVSLHSSTYCCTQTPVCRGLCDVPKIPLDSRHYTPVSYRPSADGDQHRWLEVGDQFETPLKGPPATNKDEEMDLTLNRVAHASVLLDFGGPKLLTDPWFSERQGFPGYYRGE